MVKPEKIYLVLNSFRFQGATKVLSTHLEMHEAIAEYLKSTTTRCVVEVEIRRIEIIDVCKLCGKPLAKEN